MNRLVFVLVCLSSLAFGQKLPRPETKFSHMHNGKYECYVQQTTQMPVVMRQTFCCLPGLWCEQYREVIRDGKNVSFEVKFGDIPIVMPPTPVELRR